MEISHRIFILLSLELYKAVACVRFIYSLTVVITVKFSSFWFKNVVAGLFGKQDSLFISDVQFGEYYENY